MYCQLKALSTYITIFPPHLPFFFLLLLCPLPPSFLELVSMGSEGIWTMEDKREGLVTFESFGSISDLVLARVVLSDACGLY